MSGDLNLFTSFLTLKVSLPQKLNRFRYLSVCLSLWLFLWLSPPLIISLSVYLFIGQHSYFSFASFLFSFGLPRLFVFSSPIFCLFVFLKLNFYLKIYLIPSLQVFHIFFFLFPILACFLYLFFYPMPALPFYGFIHFYLPLLIVQKSLLVWFSAPLFFWLAISLCWEVSEYT